MAETKNKAQNGKIFYQVLKEKILEFSQKDNWFEIYQNSSEWTKYITRGKVNNSDESSFIDFTLSFLFPNSDIYHEYYHIDNLACETIEKIHRDRKTYINIHQWKLLAAIEHENNYLDWTDELVKLLYINCPLRVVIGYGNYRNNYSEEINIAKNIFKKLEFDKYINQGQEFILIFGPRCFNFNPNKVNLSDYFIAYKWDNHLEEFTTL